MVSASILSKLTTARQGGEILPEVMATELEVGIYR